MSTNEYNTLQALRGYTQVSGYTIRAHRKNKNIKKK